MKKEIIKIISLVFAILFVMVYLISLYTVVEIKIPKLFSEIDFGQSKLVTWFIFAQTASFASYIFYVLLQYFIKWINPKIKWNTLSKAIKKLSVAWVFIIIITIILAINEGKLSEYYRTFAAISIGVNICTMIHLSITRLKKSTKDLENKEE